MRLQALTLTAILLAAPAFAEQGQLPAPASSVDDAPPANLPVSMDRIKQALEQAPAAPLRGLDERPHFRVQIQERQRIEALLSTLKFDSGPPVPGGLYGYQHQQVVFPSVQNPMMQPYSAFTQGQLATVAIENVLEQYLGPRMLQDIENASRARAEQTAREEVHQAFAEFCAAHGCTP
jgi:hypothetical protein